MPEQPAAHDEVVRGVQLEEEQLAWLQRPEVPATAGLPEVHLVEVGAGSQEAVPVAVGDADVGLHQLAFRNSS